jgi:hypothetical protein
MESVSVTSVFSVLKPFQIYPHATNPLFAFAATLSDKVDDRSHRTATIWKEHHDAEGDRNGWTGNHGIGNVVQSHSRRI